MSDDGTPITADQLDPRHEALALLIDIDTELTSVDADIESAKAYALLAIADALRGLRAQQIGLWP